MKLFVDDIRDAPEGWALCRTITEAIRAIHMFRDSITDISLDHDISAEVRVNGVYRPFPTEETFASVAYFVGSTYGVPYTNPPRIVAHTANPLGAESIKSILEMYGLKCEIEMKGEAFRKK